MLSLTNGNFLIENLLTCVIKKKVFVLYNFMNVVFFIFFIICMDPFEYANPVSVHLSHV